MQAIRTAHQRAKRSHFRNPGIMSWIGRASRLPTLLTILASPFLHASTDSAPELTLNCSVHSDNFGAESGLIASEEVTIKGSVLTQRGRHLVHETEGLEFWVLTHMTQKLEDDHFINNFEVAIRDIDTNRFFSALSDSVFSAEASPQTARIRLANYHSGTFHEESYIMFECRSLD